jgi:hypothetical protein
MKFTTKRKYETAVLDSLFTSGGTLSLPRKYDCGRYQWNEGTKAADFEGKEVKILSGLKLTHIWVERRQDRHGPFAQIMCA